MEVLIISRYWQMDSKNYMGKLRPRTATQCWKRTELEDWYCPISGLTIKIQYNPDSTVLVKE